MTTKENNRTIILVSAFAGVLIGGAGGYLFAAKQFNEQVAAIIQGANTKLAAANEQLIAAQEQIKALALPDLPIRVTQRPALIGSGLVVLLQNSGATELVVAVTAKSAASNQQNTWHLVLAPNGYQEIGHLQGWAFSDGDEIDLVENGYRPMKVLVHQ